MKTLANIGRLVCIYLVLTDVAVAGVDPRFYVWQKIVRADGGPASSFGLYSAGCLSGAEALPLDGVGFSVMRPSRQRYYGHPDLIRTVEGLGLRAKQKGLRLLVGDLGRPQGGPMISGHASHQNGLDVDIWLDFSRKKPTKVERERRAASSHVSKKGKVLRSWTDQHRWLVRAAAESSGVDRVFLHAALKKDLCHKFPNEFWLGKIRPWWGHDDHLHLRLVCPEASGQCEKPEPAPAGNGCDATLEWWFSAEAEAELNERKSAGPREYPKLPVVCESRIGGVLNE